MTFHPFEVNVPHLAYAFLGGFVVLFGLFSLLIKERLYIGEAVIATVFGIIIGPEALNLFSPIKWGGEGEEITNEITLEVTRVVIAIGVFAIGVELPKRYMWRHWKSIAFLLGPAMVWGWLITALLLWGIFPGQTFLTSLAIAACVTPTDPILAQAVVGGKFADKHVPAHIRHMLVAESGCNDGAAFPFLYLALYLILERNDGYAVGEWFYITWLYEVALGIIIGIILGFSARKLMKFCERKGLIDRQSFVAMYISLAVLSIGITTLLGSDDLLTAFACGTAFAWDGFFNKATEDSMFSNVIDLLFNIAAFIYIGAIIPFSSFKNAAIGLAPWRLVVFAICVLLVRRLPVILALYRWIPDIKTIREAAFVGWFGPMGVGAIFIATLARTSLPTTEGEPTDEVQHLAETIQPIVAFLVLCSVLCHGLSIPFFSLTKRVHSITRTWSRTSFDTRGDEPAWATHARRIRSGEEIVINRDEDGDAEIADDGVADRGGVIVEPDYSRHSSRTAAGTTPDSEKEQMQRDAGGELEDAREMEEGTYGGDASGEKRNDEKYREEQAEGRCDPVLAEYREGHSLIRERKRNSTDEVDVEVIRNYFHDEKPTEKSAFTHPRPLRNWELDTIRKHLPRGAHKAASEVHADGSHAIDVLGLGLMKNADLEERREDQIERETGQLLRPERPAPSQKASSSSRPDMVHHSSSNTPIPMADNDPDYEDVEDSNAKQSKTNRPRPRTQRQGSYRPPTILLNSRPVGKRRMSLKSGMRQGVGVRQTDIGTRPRDAEEGRAGIPEEPEAEIRAGRQLAISGTATPRSCSPGAGRSTIRFAPDSNESSTTAPGPSYYKKPASAGNTALSMYRSHSVQSESGRTGIRIASDGIDSSSRATGQSYYKKPASAGNPELSMFRSHSVQPDNGRTAIRFAPDSNESSATAPGPSYYKKPASAGNPSLSMYRSQSARSDTSQKSGLSGILGRLRGGS